jgi:hypothetical protein
MEQLPLANGSFREARWTAALLTQHKEGSVNLSLFCFNNSLCQEWNQHIIAFFLLDIYAKTICATSATPHILLIVRLHAREPSPSAPHIRVKLQQKIHFYVSQKSTLICVLSKLLRVLASFTTHTRHKVVCTLGFPRKKQTQVEFWMNFFGRCACSDCFFFALRDGTRSRHG